MLRADTYGRLGVRGFQRLRVYVLVQDVALPRNIPQFADAVLDLLQSQAKGCAGSRDHVFLDHQAPHVVGAEKQRELTDFRPLCDPGRLDIGNVVQIQSGDGLRAQIIVSAGTGQMRQSRVFGLKSPTDERREAAGPILELAQSFQMLDALGQCLDMAEHHRASGLAAQLVPGPMYLEPLVGEDFIFGDRLADAIYEDLGAASGQTTHAGVLEPLQYRAQRQPIELVEMPDFGSTEGMQVDARIARFEIAQHIFVPRQRQAGMIASLQEDLISAECDRFFDLLIENFPRQNISIGVGAFAVESTKIAHRRADVGVIDVAVYVVGAIRFGMQSATYRVGGTAERMQVVALEKLEPFLRGDPLPGYCLFQHLPPMAVCTTHCSYYPPRYHRRVARGEAQLTARHSLLAPRLARFLLSLSCCARSCALWLGLASTVVSVATGLYVLGTVRGAGHGQPGCRAFK